MPVTIIARENGTGLENQSDKGKNASVFVVLFMTV